ncbi:MAG: hypothetical protein QOK40_1927 [Miltoncostaeaceae bacterium]|jgi:hypothetical protein|nr:hypothetical protein [Miltoncostaeaceae bacterium]
MGRKSRGEEKVQRMKARLEEAAEELRGRAEAMGAKKPKRRRGRRLLPLAGLVAGAAALLRGGDRRDKLVEKGKGIAGKAGPVAGKAGSLLGKAREEAARLRNR